MADDGLFEAGGEQGGSPPPANGGPAEKTNIAPVAAQLDKEQLRSVAQEMFGGAVEEMSQAFKHISGELQELKAGKAPAEPVGQPQAGLSESQMEELLADPEAYIEKRAQQALAKTAGPLLQAFSQDKQAGFVAVQRAAIDEEFGEGTWAEHFDKRFGEMIETYPPQYRHEAGFKSAVNQIRGDKYETLKAKAKEQEKAKEKAVKESTRDFQVLPRGHPVPPASRLNPDEERYIAALNEHGIKQTAENYLKFKNMDGDLDSYLKAAGKEGWADGS